MKFIISTLIGLTVLSSAAFAERQRLPDFQPYCDRVTTNFNTPAGKRAVPFTFTNFRGVSQNSEAALAVQNTCVPYTTRSSFVIVRTANLDGTPAAPITTIINIEKLGDNEFDITAASSDCSDKFYNFVKPRMEATGTVFNDTFNTTFTNNLRDEYCPKYVNAVKDALIQTIKGI